MTGRPPCPIDARLDELARRGREVAGSIGALQAELVQIAAEIADLEGSLAAGTTRQWMAMQWGLTPAEAGRLARLADKLATLPQLRDGFAQGRLSEGTVDTLARVATPDNEARLLETATVATGAQLQTLVRDHRRIADAAAAGPVPDSFGWHVDERGRYRWSGSSGPELGASIVAAVDAARGRDLDDAGSGAEPLSHGAALARVAEQYLATTADLEGCLPERFLTIVHVRDDQAFLQDSGALDPSVADQFVCGSWLTSVSTRDGQPVTATARTRLATPAQVRALLVRDRCCQFPGCGRTRHLRAHHVRHHAAGGPTRLDNLVLLCATHHRLVHQPGWQLHRVGRRWRWTRPDGRPVQAGPRPVPRHPPERGPCQRPVPAGDPLTAFGRDVVLHAWRSSA